MPEPTLDVAKLIEEIALSKPAIEQQAQARYRSQEAYQARQVQRYQDLHHFYHPNDGDQWPWDKVKRPGKIHITANLVKIAVDVDARLNSLMPRFTLPTSTLGPKERLRAEAAEQILLQWLDLSGVEVWLHTLCQTRSLYGKGILKPFWDERLKRGDVSVIENPANLRLGWGSSDYSRLDWAIYEYGLSPIDVQARWPNVQVQQAVDHLGPPVIRVTGTDHTDPLDQRPDEFWKPRYREFSEYERRQVKVWDYWWVGAESKVWNATLINSVIVDGPTAHPELPDIPYIVIENDHEPSSPEGVSTVAPILDIQEEFNRLLSHGLQHIADDVDPAWYLSGPSADVVPPGLIPKAGEVIGAGENQINLIPKGVNAFPISEMIAELWTEFHRLTGLPEILFGQTPGADTSGRAIAIQVEAAANRLDPRRRRLYQGLKELLVFWTIMAEKKNPKLSIGVSEQPDAEDMAEGEMDDEGEMIKAGVGDLVKGFYHWKIIAPEVTPRDSFEVTQNEINKVNAKLSSLRSAMDAIGIEAPEAEIETISAEQSSIELNPAAVQAKVSIYPILQQVMMQQQQMSQMLQQQMAAAGQPPQSVLAQGQGAANGAMAALQGAAPTGFEDQNQPMTQAGGPPPPGSPAPAATGGQAMTTLVRGGQALNQISTQTPLGG